MQQTQTVIRPALPADEAAWRRLWAGYCDFYGAVLSDAVTSRTWNRILDPDSGVMCIVAEVEGQVSVADYVLEGDRITFTPTHPPAPGPPGSGWRMDCTSTAHPRRSMPARRRR